MLDALGSSINMLPIDAEQDGACLQITAVNKGSVVWLLVRHAVGARSPNTQATNRSGQTRHITTL